MTVIQGYDFANLPNDPTATSTFVLDMLDLNLFP